MSNLYSKQTILLVKQVYFAQKHLNIHYSQFFNSQERPVDDADYPRLERAVNHQHLHIAVVPSRMTHAFCWVASEQKSMFSCSSRVYLKSSLFNLPERNEHLSRYFAYESAIIDRKVVKNVVEVVPPIWLAASFLGTIHNYQVLYGKQDCIVASGVGIVDHVNHDVYYWHSIVVAQHSDMRPHPVSVLSQCHESTAPTVTSFL